jgi:asparagine synthase (glutamine-hydrolysing)
VKQYGNQPAKILNNLNSYVSVQTIEKVFGPVRVTGVRHVDLDRLAHLPFKRQLLVVDHLTYLASLLDRQDRASMGAGVEARLPYLDRRLVEWAMALSTDLFFDHRRAKIPLKSIAAEAFGKKFAHRRKMGFPLPVARWLEDPEGFGTFYRRLFDDNFVLDEVMDRSTVRKFLTGRHEPDRHLLNYADSERMWLGWYLMVLRTAQDVFKVRGVAA